MRRSKEDSEITRAKLLDSALDLFLQQGYQRTTLEQIAARAGVTRGAAYWHFAQGKPQLVNLLVTEKSKIVAEKITYQEQQAGNPLDKISGYLLAWCEALETDKEFRKVMQLVVFMMENVPELQDGMKKKKASIKQTLAHFTSLLEQAKHEKLVRPTLDCPSTALMIYSQLWGLTELWLLNTKAYSLHEEMQNTIEILLHGISVTT